MMLAYVNAVYVNTPQPLYNTTVWVQAHFGVSYPIHVISREKCIGYIRKGSFGAIWGPTPIGLYPKSCYNEPCYKEVEVYFTRLLNS